MRWHDMRVLKSFGWSWQCRGRPRGLTNLLPHPNPNPSDDRQTDRLARLGSTGGMRCQVPNNNNRRVACGRRGRKEERKMGKEENKKGRQKPLQPTKYKFRPRKVSDQASRVNRIKLDRLIICCNAFHTCYFGCQSFKGLTSMHFFPIIFSLFQSPSFFSLPTYFVDTVDKKKLLQDNINILFEAWTWEKERENGRREGRPRGRRDGTGRDTAASEKREGGECEANLRARPPSVWPNMRKCELRATAKQTIMGILKMKTPLRRVLTESKQTTREMDNPSCMQIPKKLKPLS